MSEAQEQMPTIDQILENHAPAEEGPAVDVVEEPTAEVAEESVEVVEEVKEEVPQRDWAALTEQEIAQLEREREHRLRMEEYESREAKIKEQEQILADLRTNPAKKLKELGITQEDIVMSQLGAEPEKLEPTVEEKLAALEEQQKIKLEELGEKIKLYEQRIADQEMAELKNQVMAAITETIEGHPDDFELIAQFGQAGKDLVNEVMIHHYEKYRKPLDIRQACDIVEKHYEETVVKPIMGAKKVKSWLAPEPVPQPKVSAPVEAAKPAPTLKQTDAVEPAVKPNLDEMDKEQALSFLTKKYKTQLQQK
jgi:hypothetical protein